MKYPTLRVVFDRKKLATQEKKGLVQIEMMHDGKRKWVSTGINRYVFGRLRVITGEEKSCSQTQGRII